MLGADIPGFAGVDPTKLEFDHLVAVVAGGLGLGVRHYVHLLSIQMRSTIGAQRVPPIHDGPAICSVYDAVAKELLEPEYRTITCALGELVDGEKHASYPRTRRFRRIWAL